MRKKQLKTIIIIIIKEVMTDLNTFDKLWFNDVNNMLYKNYYNYK